MESIFAEKINYFLFYHHFSKKGNMSILSKFALFHINCYFIGKVSPMYGILAGYSSPESIFAEKITYFLFCHHFSKIGNMSNFYNIALFHINCYFIGKVSDMHSFPGGFSSPESIFAEKITYFLFCHHFSKNRTYVIFSQNRIISHQLLLHR